MSRKFSPSSERYIVNRIHDSIAESSCDLPSNPTNSVELESGHVLESVAETEGDTCLGDGGQESLLPTEDDIEKSFRVNQDGSMTVEMRVRLTIKEEEMVHWTTTLSRSSVANQLNGTYLPEPEAEQEISSVKSLSLDLERPDSSIDTIKKDKTEDNNDEDPPSLGNGALSKSSNEEDDVKVQMDVKRRAPTPGHKQIRKKHASVESIKSLMAEGIEGGMIGSYYYKEQTEHRAMTEQYCMVKQSSTKPVPKPRRLGSVDGNNTNSRNVSTFKSAGMTEILQIESSGEEVTETVLHIYEKQTCQDNFLANLAQGMSASGIPFCRPATSGTRQLSSNNEFEPDFWRPATASESISNWRTESMSVTSDLTFPSLNNGAIQATNVHQQFPNPAKGKGKPQQREANKDKRVFSKPKVVKKRALKLKSPGKRQKENSTGATKKVKSFSSAGFIKRIYGNKSKSTKSVMKLKKGIRRNGDEDVTTKSSQQLDDTIKCILKDQNVPSALKENKSEMVSLQNGVANKASQPRGILTRQTSVHREKKNANESCDVKEIMSLPTLNASSSVTNEYVENWLEKAHHSPTAYADEESKKLEEVTLLQTENGECGENKNGLLTVAKEVQRLKETSEIQTCETHKPDLLPDNVRRASVKQRIQSFENKSSSPSMEKKTANQQIVHSHTTTTNTENCSSLAQNNMEEINHSCSEIVPPIEKTSTEIPSGSENKSRPIKISFRDATPSNSLSMDLPPPPSPAEIIELSNAEDCVMDVSSAASSPLYRLSLVSSQMSDNHPLSISPTSDKAVSPIDHTTEMTTSIQTDIPSTLGETPLPRTLSIKRAPLVSNLSLDRKMSLRKACLDKYTLCSDATSEATTSSTPINIVGDNALPNSICSKGTQLPSETLPEESSTSDPKDSPSCCSSAYPTSLASEERMSTASFSSSEASTTSSLPLKGTKTNKTPLLTQMEASSPKALVKKVKLRSSPSSERKSQTKKLSSELPHNSPKLASIHNHPPDKTMSPNVGIRKHASSSPERKQVLYKPKLQKRLSPYSQSLDMVSPPVRHKSSRKVLTRNLSSDSASELTNRTQRRTSSERKRHQTPQSIKSTAELYKTLNCNTEADQSDNNKVNNTDDTITEKSMVETQVMPEPFNIANQPNMKPVVEEICYSIKSIRQMTQNKRPSCLEKSNSLPDFSSHVASTFGSSSKALLAFLSVMTLKGGTTNLCMDELNANDVSCAEALKMIDSLRQIATIEDSHKLKVSLSNLQQSASKQLMQIWKGFQELSDKCKSRSSKPNDSEQEVVTQASPEKDIDENIIDEIMENLDIPTQLKEELASLSVGVKSDSDNKEKTSMDDVVNVRDVTQDEKTNVDVSAIIKKFTDIHQPKQSSTGNITKTAKHITTDQETKDKDSKHGKNGVTTCPPAAPNDEQIHEERQLYSTLVLVKENEDGTQSGMDAVHQENQQEKQNDEDESYQGKANLNGVVSSNKTFEQGSCPSEVEEKHMKGNQLQREESMTIAVNEHSHDDQPGSEQEGQNVSSANKDLEQKVTCEQSVRSSEAGEQHSSEEEPEVEREGIQQENGESDDLSNHESHSEEEEDKQARYNYYVELNVRTKGSPDSHNKYLSEVECTELSKDVLSNPKSPSNSEEEQLGRTGCMGLNVSVDENTCNSDVDEPSSEEEQAEVECRELKVITEENVSVNEEEQERVEEEEHLDDLPDKTKKHRRDEEDRFSSDNEDHHVDKTKQLRNLIENQDSYTTKDNSSLIKSDNLTKRYRFSADEDSGNDHSSCEEHAEVEQPKVRDEQISSSIEEQLSYYDKEPSSEDEHTNVDRYIEERCAEYQEASLAAQSEVKTCEKAVEKVKHPSEEIIPQSIAERVILLEKQVADAQNTTVRSPMTRFSQRNAPLESDGEDSELPKSESALGTQSAPQSSLTFSYDSCSVITTEPEGNRVRSIREMFLAKSATDIQHGHRRYPCPNRSGLSELRAETSVSGGYQSQTSSDLSSGEDDSARKSISKGFVRRTIERLYGKKDANPDEEASERPPSAPKQKKKEPSGIFSPFHITRSKAMSELSYFNSTNALDTLGEATRCVAFNAQVGPGDSVPIDNGRWLFQENTLIRKSVSDPVGINKAFTNSPQSEELHEDTEENTPCPLFSTKSELEDNKESFSRKCIYFSLPHASDSEVCQDDPSTVSKGTVNGDSVIDTKDNSKDAKTWAERNGKLPAGGITDFKMMDNKVHPLIELPPDGEVVVAQPGRGQGVVNRRIQEPDMLDLLYNFCGQNCPIL